MLIIANQPFADRRSRGPLTGRKAFTVSTDVEADRLVSQRQIASAMV